jgi:hypothetical protein
MRGLKSAQILELFKNCAYFLINLLLIPKALAAQGSVVGHVLIFKDVLAINRRYMATGDIWSDRFGAGLPPAMLGTSTP